MTRVTRITESAHLVVVESGEGQQVAAGLARLLAALPPSRTRTRHRIRPHVGCVVPAAHSP